jgi:hypothetical protein
MAKRMTDVGGEELSGKHQNMNTKDKKDPNLPQRHQDAKKCQVPEDLGNLFMS